MFKPIKRKWGEGEGVGGGANQPRSKRYCYDEWRKKKGPKQFILILK